MRKLIIAISCFFASSPVMSESSSSQNHYLVLQGENFLPVTEAIATPNATLFIVDQDYLPVPSESHGCTTPSHGNHQSVTVTDTATSPLRGGAAVAYAGKSVKNTRPCMHDLGTTLAGSYLFDDIGGELGGQDFAEPARLLMGSFLLEDDENEEDIENFLVIAEGGMKRAADPNIHMLTYGNAIIIDYPVPPRSKLDGFESVGKVYAPGAPELPITVKYDLTENNHAGYPIYAPIENLIEALEDALPEPTVAAEDDSQALLVVRAPAANDTNAIEERLKAIHKKIRDILGPSVNLRTAYFGQQIPVCSDSNLACQAMNESIILYHNGLKKTQ